VRVLLDECVDVRLAASLATVDVRTVEDQGWLGISNGELLALAAAEFDVFVTVDRNLPFQQHLPRFDIAVILLRAKEGVDDLDKSASFEVGAAPRRSTSSLGTR
jgi:cephalosporin-C deacetylase-like acetyl esterase